MTREDHAFQIRWEEYKVIQEKIDRIGDFRFRLRSWVIALVVAAVGAARPAAVPPVVFVLGFVVIVAFYMLETAQLRWANALGNRAGVLEAELRASYGAPGIVGALAFASRLTHRRPVVGAFLRADGRIFYGLLCVLVAVGLWLSVDADRVVEATRSTVATILLWIKAVLPCR